jgi:hypothetical protein
VVVRGLVSNCSMNYRVFDIVVAIILTRVVEVFIGVKPWEIPGFRVTQWVKSIGYHGSLLGPRASGCCWFIEFVCGWASGWVINAKG